MKKFITLLLSSAMIFAFANVSFAQNAVSQMATTAGGQAVAQCAQDMNKAVSECAKMPVCVDMGM